MSNLYVGTSSEVTPRLERFIARELCKICPGEWRDGIVRAEGQLR